MTSVGVEGRERVVLSGVGVDRLDLDGARALLAAFLDTPGLHHVVTVNLDFLRLARSDPLFRRVLDEADAAVADGMPLVWASRLLRRPLPARVTGIALAEECCRLSAATGAPLFLLGARDGVAAQAARAIVRRHAGAVVADAYAPPFGTLSPAEDRQLVERVNRSRAGILLVALGAPRQDTWISLHRGELDVRLALGVGCALDVFAGVSSRAPGWMQRSGLEWLYRLWREPTRLWRRYVVDDMPMFARLLAESARAGLGS